MHMRSLRCNDRFIALLYACTVSEDGVKIDEISRNAVADRRQIYYFHSNKLCTYSTRITEVCLISGVFR